MCRLQSKDDRAGRGIWFAPVIAPLLRRRLLMAISAAAGIAQVCLAALHLPGTPCPMLIAIGIPCPGCGGSRACAALIRGHWSESLRWHAFAPFFLLAIVLFTVAAVLPRRPRYALAATVASIERRTGLTGLLLLLLMLYWLGRLAYSPQGFANLVRGG